jgi:hypothetical protein
MKTVLANRKTGEAIVLVSLAAAAAETLIVAGASSEIQNDAGIAGDETVSGAVIAKVKFGTAPGATWTVTRAGDIVGVFNGSGEMAFDSDGMALTHQAASDIVFTLAGAGAGFLVVELQKKSTIANDQYLRG